MFPERAFAACLARLKPARVVIADEAPIEIRFIHDNTCASPPVGAVDPELVALRRGVVAGLPEVGVVLICSFVAYRWWGWPAWLLWLPPGYAAIALAGLARGAHRGP